MLYLRSCTDHAIAHPQSSSLRDFHRKHHEIKCSRWVDSMAGLRRGRGPEALAVVAGHSWLFLRETQQLLPNGLDQGGRRVSRRRGLERQRRRHVAHTWGVNVHGGSRRLLDKTPGCLEDRGVWVVKTIQELKAGGTEESRKRRENKD